MYMIPYTPLIHMRQHLCSLALFLLLANAAHSDNRLFPTDIPHQKVELFRAKGYAEPVAGIVTGFETPPLSGMPLGGVSTGALDIQAEAVWGYSHIFNPDSIFTYNPQWRMPRIPPSFQPMFALSVGGRNWVLTSKNFMDGSENLVDMEPHYPGGWVKESKIEKVRSEQIANVSPALDIHYWGHYPIVDMEFETSSTVRVGVRAWAPFLPGDSARSNTPAAMFEVHLSNITSETQQGSFVMNFPGPTTEEAGSIDFIRQETATPFRALEVNSTSNVGYVLAVLDEPQVRFGTSLQGKDWSSFSTQLPQTTFRSEAGQRKNQSGSASGAVDFKLLPGESRIIRYLLAWYAPVWKGGRRVHQGAQPTIEWRAPQWLGNQLYYTNMYASRYNSAYEVAQSFAQQHSSLLRRIIQWQSVLYSDAQLPAWLKDSLINNLHLITENSYWAQPKPPLGEWAFPIGVFGMNESSRGCPHMNCIPCDWYGNLPLVYFFPDLALSTLNTFRQYQHKDGEIPFALGQIGDLADFASPEYTWQQSLNGTCYIEMLYRLWRRTGRLDLLKEYYPSARSSNDFTMALSALPGHVIRMPDAGGMEWFEHGEWAGMATHMGGLHLAQLRQMEAMAKAIGDRDYEEQCTAWLDDGMGDMEREMWNESYYLNFKAPEKNAVSDDVMAYQLDGEWVVRFHGLEGVFRPDRVSTTLNTIARLNVALTPEIGAANFTRPNGTALEQGKKANPDDDTISTQNEEEVSHYGLYTMFVAELPVLGMTYMLDGRQEFGLEMIRKHWNNLVIHQRLAWDMPNMVDGKTGTRIFGTDYYQAMMLWAVPSVVKGQTMEQFCAPGELVARILSAAQHDPVAVSE